MQTHKNNSAGIGEHKFNGQWFGYATYAEKAESIHATKAEMATLASAMSDGDLDAALLEVKTITRRMSDPEAVLVAEMKARAEQGKEFEHFWLDSYPQAGAVDWVAIGAATGLSKEAARAKFAGTKTVKALKPKA